VNGSATKFILKCDLNCPEHLAKLGLLPVEFRREVLDLCIFFKCLKGHIDFDALSYGRGHWGLRYCGIRQFFMRYFGNFNFKLRCCGVLRIGGMTYSWRFGQRYLIKKKLFYRVADPLLV